MVQITTGIRSVLNFPQVYELFMDYLGAKELRRFFVDRCLRPQPKDRILDVGCGTGTTVAFLPEGIDYIGVDLSSAYVAFANRRFGDQVDFRVGDVNEMSFGRGDCFDIVTAMGLLHHLNDAEVVQLAKTARKLLKANGRFVTIDVCFTEDQSPIARALIQRDRGRNVRNPHEYVALMDDIFDRVNHSVRHDLLRIPYTHVIIEAVVNRH